MVKLCKKERKHAFKKLEGWFSNKATLEYSDPEKGLKKLDQLNYLKLTYIDPDMDHALYKCLQIMPVDQMNAIAPVATAATNTIVNNHNIGLQGAVASYDRIHGQIILELIDMDDKSTWICKGDGKIFRGTSKEFSLQSALNDKVFGGGYTAGFKLKKLKNTPKGFESFDFDKVYKTQYDKYYLNNNNNNNNNDLDNIPLDSIATESAPNIWFINKDVIILQNQKLAIDKGKYVTTIHNFTNNGTFINEGTFCTAKNFTNNDNANFNNNGGTTLIYLGGIFNNNGTIENKKGENTIGNIINLQSTYNLKTPGILIGEPVLIIQ